MLHTIICFVGSHVTSFVKLRVRVCAEEAQTVCFTKSLKTYLLNFVVVLDLHRIQPHTYLVSLLFVDLWHLRTVVAILGKGLSEASFTTVFLYTAELYPTVLRSVTVLLI